MGENVNFVGKSQRRRTEPPTLGSAAGFTLTGSLVLAPGCVPAPPGEGRAGDRKQGATFLTKGAH